jgi:hypothetical protein
MDCAVIASTNTLNGTHNSNYDLDSSVFTAQNTLKETWNGSKTLPLILFLSIVVPPAIDANALAILNAWPTKYEIKVVSQATSQTAIVKLLEKQMSEEFKPKTEFVKKLLAFRKEAIAYGMPLLTVDEILAAKRDLRGEVD